MQHLCAFYKEFSSFIPIPLDAVIDDVLLRPSADRFQVPAGFNSIAWAAAHGETIITPRIISPSLEARKMSINIIPYYRGGLVWPKEAGHVFVPKVELNLDPLENFQVWAAENTVGGSINEGFVSLKAPGPMPVMPAGDVRQLIATSSEVAWATQWTTITPVFERPLQPGTYELIGFIPIASAASMARVMIKGQAWRPGVPAISNELQDALYHADNFYDKLMWYPMGTFSDVTPPQFQFFTWANTAIVAIIMYVVKIG